MFIGFVGKLFAQSLSIKKSWTRAFIPIVFLSEFVHIPLSVSAVEDEVKEIKNKFLDPIDRPNHLI